MHEMNQCGGLATILLLKYIAAFVEIDSSGYKELKCNRSGDLLRIIRSSNLSL